MRVVFNEQDLPRRKVVLVDDIADTTGLTPRTVRRAIDRGEMPGAYKAPGTRRWLIPRDSALKFMNGRAS